MEIQECDSSNHMVKKQLHGAPRISAKSNQIYPIELLEKELDVENGTTHVKQECHQIKVTTDSVFLPQKQQKSSVAMVVHIRPKYWLGSFLQGIELVGDDSSSFSVEKVRSFPGSKYEIIDKARENATFELSSNFLGSKYHLTKDGITHLTITFQVGCGARCRSFNIYTLRQKVNWTSLDGVAATTDLEELYGKSTNYESIARYTNLQPTLCPETGASYLKFSRRSVVPCVENTIICNLNGQKVLELMKINDLDSLFEVCLECKWPLERILAIIVASFDFKLGLE